MARSRSSFDLTSAIAAAASLKSPETSAARPYEGVALVSFGQPRPSSRRAAPSTPLPKSAPGALETPLRPPPGTLETPLRPPPTGGLRVLPLGESRPPRGAPPETFDAFMSSPAALPSPPRMPDSTPRWPSVKPRAGGLQPSRSEAWEGWESWNSPGFDERGSWQPPEPQDVQSWRPRGAGARGIERPAELRDRVSWRVPAGKTASGAPPRDPDPEPVGDGPSRVTSGPPKLPDLEGVVSPILRCERIVAWIAEATGATDVFLADSAGLPLAGAIHDDEARLAGSGLVASAIASLVSAIPGSPSPIFEVHLGEGPVFQLIGFQAGAAAYIVGLQRPKPLTPRQAQAIRLACRHALGVMLGRGA